METKNKKTQSHLDLIKAIKIFDKLQPLLDKKQFEEFYRQCNLALDKFNSYKEEFPEEYKVYKNKIYKLIELESILRTGKTIYEDKAPQSPNITYSIWSFIANVFFRSPYEKSIILGLFRTLFYLYLIIWTQEKTNDVLNFCDTLMFDFSRLSYSFMYNFACLPLIYFGGKGFFMFAGWHINAIPSTMKRYNEAPYKNISDALSYQDAISNNKTNQGKVEEYAKTGFLNINQSMSKTQEEAMDYLDAILNAYPTNQKYEKLKEFYGNK